MRYVKIDFIASNFIFYMVIKNYFDHEREPALGEAGSLILSVEGVKRL